MDVVTLKLANQYTDASGGGGGGSTGGNVPAGGYVGQVLTKKSDENYDSEWQNIPAGDWDNLQNRPFGYEYAFIDWDGNTEGKEVIDGQYYKVSDALFPVDYVGAVIFINGEVWEITHEMVSYGENHTDVSINGKVYIKEYWSDPHGVYFLNDGTEYVQRVERSYVRKLDPAFVDTMNPDWNDNDPNSQRYINGRTHWTEYNYAEPIELPESELSWQDTGATLEDVPILKAEGTNDLIPNANISLGQYVIVRWGENGGSWTAIAYDPASYGIEFEGGILLGNMALHPDGGTDHFDTGEPYLILLRGNEYIMYTRETQTPSPSVVLDVMSETVYQLEEKYIPDSIMRTADVDAAVDTALKGKIVQSNWNTNDESSPSFVQGRTHWVEDNTKNLFLNLSNPKDMILVGSGMNDGYEYVEFPNWEYNATADGTIAFKKGNKYKIEFLGSSFECISEDGNMYPEVSANIFIGNMSIVYPFADTGENFLIGINSDYSARVYVRKDIIPDATAEYQIRISEGEVVYHPLDDNFIPETIARKEPVDTAIAQIVSTLQNAKKHTFGMVYFAPTANTDVEMRMLSSIYRENSHIGIEGENKYFNARSIFNVTFALNFETESEVSYTINSASLDFGTQGTIPVGRSQHIVKFVVDVPFLTGGMGSEFTLNDLKFNCTGDVTLKDSYYTVEEYQQG